MKKIMVGIIFLFITIITMATGEGVVDVPPVSDSVNEIVDEREILQLEEIRLPEIKNEDIAIKLSELETSSLIYKDKIALLEKNLVEKEKLVTELENKVEKLLVLTNALDERGKETNTKIMKGIKNSIYKTGIIVLSVLAGVTIILIALVMLQSNKNKKLVEEWKEFFEMNIDRIKNDSHRDRKDKLNENIKNEFMERMKREKELEELENFK